jgi:methylmalonyl-CoA epimerase
MTAWPLDHIGIAVPSIAEARPAWERLCGTQCGPTLDVSDQGVRVAFLGGIELLEPVGAESPVARFLRSRGPGLHHVAFRVADLVAELRRLEEAGVRLVDREPRLGAAGHPIAFLHPSAAGGLLVELVQIPDR